MKNTWMDGGMPWQPTETIAVFMEPARHPRTPERRLCQAVLEQALLDLQRLHYAAVRARLSPRAQDVVAWFRSVDASWPFSFEAVCANLGLDASAVRRAVGLTTAGSVRLVARSTVVTLSPSNRTGNFQMSCVKNGRFSSRSAEATP